MPASLEDLCHQPILFAGELDRVLFHPDFAQPRADHDAFAVDFDPLPSAEWAAMTLREGTQQQDGLFEGTARPWARRGGRLPCSSRT
ncbi:hypothetical protein [Streptomyces olivoreticuli]|uniref:hypothetical protein n=1 Tax=Streptomyces olivoreticuli TaxID=68246 RepID=UPI001F082C84|nr:hypothetical protein [Streptomyces olivoreticuli]